MFLLEFTNDSASCPILVLARPIWGSSLPFRAQPFSASHIQLIFTPYVPRQMVKWSIRMVKYKSGHRTFTTTDYF
ncbi:hypothetical protein T09_14029 [Trichinella sp. T9]|nr:hypothetical protein T09_14029 [Trichinella sp. T9]